MAKLPEYFHFRILYGKTKIEIQNVSDHDFVEVVRCKDCKEYSKCGSWYGNMEPDDYCSLGSKKDEDDGT